mgnify:CR=1 FL=1
MPLIFSPLGLVLILLFAFLIRKNQSFIFSALLFLLIFSTGIFSEILWIFLESPWKRLDYSSINSSQGIVVLSNGGRHIPKGKTKIIEWSDPDRFISGINLYKKKKANKLIFTGGVNPFSYNLPPEGQILLEEAILMGIPEKDLFTTEPVFNTFQEAKAVNKLLNQEKTLTKKEIILVTSAFHMKRAKKLFEREGIIVQPYPVDFKRSKSFFKSLSNPISWIPSAYNLKESSSAIREIIGRTIYRTF